MASIARRLWPAQEQRTAGPCAAIVFLTSFFPFIFGTVVMFDLLLLFWVLLGWWSLLRVSAGGSVARNCLLVGLAIGMGILSKGPVVLLYLVPTALGALHWSRDTGWAVIRALAGGLLIGVLLALAWAIPAGRAGGEEYHNAIFWGQTAGRMKESFAHARPWHWYLPILPAMMIPWLLLPGCWRGWKRVQNFTGVAGEPLRFLCWAAIPGIIILSSISGKQPHYLLPMAAVISLALGAHFTLNPRSTPRSFWGLLGPAGLLLVLGVLVVALPTVAKESTGLSWLIAGWNRLPGVLLILAAPLFLFLARNRRWQLTLTALVTPTLLLALNLAASSSLFNSYNMKPIAERVAVWQEEGVDVAFFGARYHGQFTFAGALNEPLANPHRLEDLLAWARDHGDGRLLIVVKRNSGDRFTAGAKELIPYRAIEIAIWRAEDFVNSR